MCALVTGVQTCALPIYGPIYGVQQPGELVGGASAGTREYFRQQYRRLDDPDDDVATAHPHSEEIEFTSLIIDRAAAVTERARLAAIYGEERQRFRAPVPTGPPVADPPGEARVGRPEERTGGKEWVSTGRWWGVAG